ncbi:MAG TPA: cupredoxin domain-containing protein [Candidatus Sulfomarinibacteraceae bacterium]|nr:cupredoxin domain-containing protein [Candidatus Sulfomarinibacteraceae bacterium]
MKLAAWAILALALVGALAACGGGTPSPSTTVTEVTLTGTEFGFEPKAVEIAAGAKLKITLVNKGTLEHDVSIDALGVKLLVPVGQTLSVTTAEPVPAGTYEIYCAVAGHKEAGMTGTLTVK